MVYVALLRGINVGGKSKVEMVRLKKTFEHCGFRDVKTYINSGNVIFTSASKDQLATVKTIEAAIEKEFKLKIPVVVRSQAQIAKLLSAIPTSWVNDAKTKCDVMFLRPEIDQRSILKQIPHNPDIEDVVYYPGAIVWRIDRKNVNRGKVLKIIGSAVHKQLTVRNPNTVRKLYKLMQALS